MAYATAAVLEPSLYDEVRQAFERRECQMSPCKTKVGVPTGIAVTAFYGVRVKGDNPPLITVACAACRMWWDPDPRQSPRAIVMRRIARAD